MKKYTLFCFLAVCTFISAVAQQSSDFVHYTTTDGLSQNTITCVYQDKNGMMWFGTTDGLNKFDGKQFTIYRKTDDETSQIDNTVNIIAEDKQGNLLIGNQKGLSIYNRGGDNFSRQTFGGGVLAIFTDTEGILWVGTTIGLYRGTTIFDMKSVVLANNIANDGVYDIEEDKLGTLWLGTSKALVRFDKETGEVLAEIPNAENRRVKPVILDNTGRIWCAFGGGLSVFTPSATDKRQFTQISYTHSPTNPQSIPEGTVMSLLCDHRRNIWVGVENGGLLLFERSDVGKTDAAFNPLIRGGETDIFDKKSIHFAYEDRQNNVWLGTYNGGIYMYNKSLHKFRHITFENSAHVTKSNSVKAICADGIYLWIGGEDGLVKYNRNTGQYNYYEHIEGDNTSMSANPVCSIIKDSQQNIWLGTWGGGLSRYNKSTNNFTNYMTSPTDTTTISNNNAMILYEDSKGMLWVGTYFGGLCRFDPKTNKFKRYYANSNDSKSIGSNLINSICEDDDGTLWIGHVKALDRFDPATEEFTHYQQHEGDSTSMPSSFVEVVFIDSRKNVWAGTKNGLSVYNRNNSQFVSFTADDGLPNSYIRAIEEDNRGYLWISTNKGLVNFLPPANILDADFDKRTVEFRVFTVTDGLQDYEFARRASCKIDDGQLCFGGQNGLNIFFPDSIVNNKYLPGIVFTDFLLFNKKVAIGGEGSPLHQHISETRYFELTHTQTVFTLSFVALNYLNPDQNQYAYMLEGLETEWNYVGTQRSATYTNLDPGTYTFRVKASNNDGVWNEEGTFITIKVLPPWWETLWFRISVGLVVVGSAVAFYKVRTNSLKRQKRILEEEVAARTADLSDANTNLEERQEEISQQNDEILMQNEQIKQKNEALQQTYNNIETLSRFGKQLTASLDIENINKLTYSYINSVIRTSALGIGIYDSLKRRINFYSFIENGNDIPFFRIELDADNNMAAIALRNQHEIVIQDYDNQSTDYTTQMPMHWKKPASAIYLPLLAQEGRVGVLVVHHTHKNAFAVNDLNILRSLASYIAIAISNAGAYTIINSKNMQIKDSMNYAQTIQRTILPAPALLKPHFDNFVLYRPKDIVSGDFYWFYPVSENVQLIAVVDCTGHGVPGAFMSLIGYNGLNLAAAQTADASPREILDRLNHYIQTMLKQHGSNNANEAGNEDGMDVCLCRIERLALQPKSYQITFSGAKRSLLYIEPQNIDLQTLKGDVKSIGGTYTSDFAFTEQTITVGSGTTLYLTSDGYTDQNNAERRSFGSKRLAKLLVENTTKTMAEQKTMLEEALDQFKQTEEQRDDIAIVGVRLP